MASPWMIFAAVALGASCSSSPSSPPPPAPAAAKPISDPMHLAQLDAFLQDQVTKHGFPGLAAGVITRDGLVWGKGYGVRDLQTHEPVGPDTLFRIGSITKVLTALAVLQLRDAGKLDLDAPAAKWLPELAAVIPATRDSPPITLRHLMTHTSGLPREPQILDPYGIHHEVTEQELLASLATTKLESATGTSFSYSNLGAALEGLVIARASGQPYTAYMQDHLLHPFGMTTATFDRAQIPASSRATSYDRNKAGVLEPSRQLQEGATAARGQLYASIRDMARFATIELLAWPPRDDPDDGPIHRSTLRESQRTEGPFPPGIQTKGAGWFLEATARGTLVEHGGAGEGFMSEIWIATSANLAFVVMINDNDPAITSVAHEAHDILSPLW